MSGEKETEINTQQKMKTYKYTTLEKNENTSLFLIVCFLPNNIYTKQIIRETKELVIPGIPGIAMSKINRKSTK